MENIYEEPKYHQTEFRISISALQKNLDYFTSLLKPGTKVMLMLKAAAYGHSSTAIAKHFQNEKRIEYFAVAYADEGIRLRKAAIEKSILVLNPSPNSFSAMVENCLEPEIHNLDLLNQFIDFLKISKTEGAPYPIHLKFNTGMNRLGFEQTEIPELINTLQAQFVVSVRSIMTHLSSSNIVEEDDFSQSQLNLFKKVIEETKTIQYEETFFHCLNSNGIFRFNDHQYDLVRLGIGFYGTSTVAELGNNLQAAAKLVSRISQIRKVKKGDSISYSRSGRALSDTQIATLSIGYADGLNRLLGNGKWEVEINGKLYPTIGNICMDLSMINIGKDQLSIGDEVIIFGGEKSIYELADCLGTITYEVMCSIGPRVKRIISE